MATPPSDAPWGWVPPDWLGGADIMPAPELQFPEDRFESVTPDALAAARAERDAETEIQFPPDDFASVPPDELAAARAARDAEAAPAPDEIEMPEDYAGRDPLATGFARSPENPYIGFPRNPDEVPPAAPVEAPPAALELPAEPDAITGAGGVPLAPLVPGLGIPQATFEQAMAQLPTTTAGVPELPEEYLTNQEAGQAFARLTPEQQIEKQLDLEARREDFARTERAKAAKADAEEAERDERDWRTSRDAARRDLAQIDAEAKAEAAREIDINRGWANASTGTKIAGIFSALAGGLVAHKYGGRNSGLEMIDKLIERDIEAQKFDRQTKLGELARRGGSARDRLQMAGDDFREETRLRLTAYDRVLGQITADAQNFDPRGTQAIRYGQAYQDLAAKRAQLAQDAQKRAADGYKEQLDFASKELDLQKKQAEIAKAQRAAMGGGARPTNPKDVVQTPEYFKARGLVPPPIAMSENAYDDWQKNKKTSVEIEEKTTGRSIGGVATQVKGEDGKTRLEFKPLINADGSEFRPNVDEAKEVRAQKAAVDTINQFTNEMIRGIAKHGGESAFFKSDDWQVTKSKQGFVANALRVANKMGTLDAGSMAAVEQMMGAVDPTSFWADASAGLISGRDASIAQFNNTLRSMNYTGPDYRPPDTARPVAAKKDASDKTQAHIMADPTRIDGAEMFREIEARRRAGDVGGDSQIIGRILRDNGGMLPSQRKALAALADDLNGKDKAKRSRARQSLVQAAGKAEAEGVREYATGILNAEGMGDDETEGPAE